MADQQYLQDIIELGLHLRTLGPEWAKYLPAIRDGYRALKNGTGGIDAKHVMMLRQVLQLDPGMKESKGCPRCPPPLQGDWGGARTVFMFPDRHTCQCARCGTEWVVMERSESDARQ